MENKPNLEEDKIAESNNSDSNNSMDLGSYPKLTDESLSMFLKDMEKFNKYFYKSQLNPDFIVDENYRQFGFFLTLLGNTAINNPEFEKSLANWKMALVLTNRTTALMSAFLTGVAIGTFLNSPHLVLEDKESEKENKGEKYESDI
jgi:hypothetical protein